MFTKYLHKQSEDVETERERMKVTMKDVAQKLCGVKVLGQVKKGTN